MQHVLALDLKDDPALIAAYEAHHRAVWPEVLDHLRRHGVIEMATTQGRKWTPMAQVFDFRQ